MIGVFSVIFLPIAKKKFHNFLKIKKLFSFGQYSKTSFRKPVYSKT